MTSYAKWIDIPVIEAIDYFSGVMAKFFNWGSHYAIFIGTVGLCWSAFKLANSRFTLRDFWWDTFYKFFIFILCMSIYPLTTLAMSSMANTIGTNAGEGKQAIIDSLSSLKSSILKDINLGNKLETELNRDIKNVISKTENITFDTTFGNSNTYDEFIDKYYDEVKTAKFKSNKAKKKALELINEYREKNKYHSLFSRKTLAAINNILIVKNPDGSKGHKLTNSYLDLNIWIKNSDGTDSCYLSPAALMRVTVLGCQIMWEKNELSYAMNLDELDEEDVNFMKKGFNKMGATFAHIPAMLMTMICCIVLVFCGIFACIQYIMTIIEYIIISGIGAFFIPFILFDGTKELPKKLIPVFTGLLLKIIVITICMFFVFYLFIQETVEIISENGGMNWVTLVTVVFNCIIGFILTQNAPKIAQTLLTGQPQLSMGEFVQAVGTMAAGAKIGSKLTSTAGHIAKEGTRKAAQSTIDLKGGITKIKSAAKTAGQTVSEMGGNQADVHKASIKGAFASFTGSINDKLHNTGNNFLHGKNSSNSHTSGGNGSQAHQRSGQNTSRDLGPEDSRVLNTNSNPNFKSATRFDPSTQTNINMTRKEFYDEKAEQGKIIGKQIAAKIAKASESKNISPDDTPTLPDLNKELPPP